MATRQSKSSAFQNAQSVLRFSYETTGSRNKKRTGQSIARWRCRFFAPFPGLKQPTLHLSAFRNSMKSAHSMTDYVFGSSEAEHERLMRQAETLAPYTERLFREAGIVRGQRVLDVGSGVGDVALLAASLVGTTGSVLGIDRDAMALSKARSRAAAARASNIQFLETDLSKLRIDGDFDAIVGRFIL